MIIASYEENDQCISCLKRKLKAADTQLKGQAAEFAMARTKDEKIAILEKSLRM